MKPVHRHSPVFTFRWIAVLAGGFALCALPALVGGLVPAGPDSTRSAASAAVIPVQGNSGQAGFHLTAQNAAGVEIHFGMDSFSMDPLQIGGETFQKISLAGVFLPNDAGAPDLPGMGRFVAVPQGAVATFEIVSSRTQVLHGIELAPAPVIPRETDRGPLVYSRNVAIYGRDAYYPAAPVLLSTPAKMRGVDVVTVGITPFQYNPVTKELLVYTDLNVRIRFQGGNGHFGEDRLRSRYWEPILEEHLINYATLPAVDLNRPRGGRNGFEYVIITPDNPDFIAWADTLKAWRKLQGISTEVFTTTEVGTTAPAIESWLNNAYNTWDPAPDAFLLLGDYPGTGFTDNGITSPTWNSYCVSDNMYADVDADNLPDMVHARITARNAAELQTMIGKMLAYERHPYTDPGFYDHPIIAGGWQTERWFILCCEIVFGHQANVLGKHPTREYAIYQGVPGTEWSSNPNTYMLVDYFGPGGLGYIPATPEHLTDWGGNATRINNDINAGAYMLIHRDHGAETGWGEPAYGNSSLSGLHNEMLPFVFSMNCLTGKYNWSSECFSEAFHRMGQGALGLIAASEVSYSFVNDTYIFGLFDTMWPGFMPDYGPYPPQSHFADEMRPAFGQVSGKYFLQASNWPYNPGDKLVTYHLFHHHGDAFLTMYSEVPRDLAVSHDEVCFIGTSTFRVQATAGSVISLTVNGEIIGVADATGMPQEVPIIPPTQPSELRITVTKANFYRYDRTVPILPPDGPYLILHNYTLHDLNWDWDGAPDAGETLRYDLTLRNVGVDPTTGVSAQMTTADPFVVITSGVQGFPDIPAGGTGASLQPYELRLSGAVPDQHPVSLALAIHANEGDWQGSIGFIAQAPVLEAGGTLIDDSVPLGNGDGGADPGDRFNLMLWLHNSGHSSAPPLRGTLSCADPHVQILDPQGECTGVPVGDSNLLTSFQIALAPDCPSPATIPFQVHLTADNGLDATVPFELPVGAWMDDAEVDRGWTLGAPGDNAATGIWERAEPVGTVYNGQQAQPEYDHTPDPASICFVTGNGVPGGAAGDSDVDGGKTTLLSPVFDLATATSATVEYWRWYTNNLGNNPNQDYWDVDVTADGSSWVHLEHTTNSANSWTHYSFNVRDFVPLTARVQFRFVADDEAPGSLVEAAVDDFSLTVVGTPATGVARGERTGSFGILGCVPNPSRSSTAITYRLAAASPVKLDVYNIAGRLVRTLVDRPVGAGIHLETFDALDRRGEPLPSGVYFLRLVTREGTQARRLTLLK